MGAWHLKNGDFIPIVKTLTPLSKVLAIERFLVLILTFTPDEHKKVNKSINHILNGYVLFAELAPRSCFCRQKGVLVGTVSASKIGVLVGTVSAGRKELTYYNVAGGKEPS